jgi:outer membrane lipoprotein-sorting protein
MIRKPRFVVLGLLLLVLFLPGCPKKIVKIPPIEAPPAKNPISILLEAFSAVENFQSKASIRIDTVRKGEQVNIPLNGFVFYQRPDELRILGYLPWGMGLFDALYVKGEFFLLSPLQKKAFTGEVSEFQDLIEKEAIQISTEKTPGDLVPNLIRIGLEEKHTRIDIRLKEISVNSTLPEDVFRWVVPEGVEVRPLAQLLKGKKY